MAYIVEKIFRRLVRLLFLIILLPMLSVAVAYIVIPKTYSSSASLWALRRYGIVTDTTDVIPNPPPTPADTQVGALTALLQTRDFALSVANDAGLVETLDANVRAVPELSEQAMIDDMSKHVLVTAQGDNLFTITYSNKDAQVAQRVVAATIQNFELHTAEVSQLQGQRLLDNYQQQLSQAIQSANDAAAQEAHYLAAHPQLANTIQFAGLDSGERTDPNYNNLHTQTTAALARVQQIQTQMANIQLEVAAQGGGAETLFNIIDAPVVASKADGRTKSFLIVGGAALGLAILACIFFIIIAVRGERVLYTKRDVQLITELPVVIQIPRLASIRTPSLAE